MGIEWGMALSTVATILAFIVLAIMLRNIRQLGLVACNILTGIGTALGIMRTGADRGHVVDPSLHHTPQAPPSSSCTPSRTT